MGRPSKLRIAAAFVAIAVTTVGACGSRQPGVASTASGTPSPQTTALETQAPATPEPTESTELNVAYTCGGHAFSPAIFNEPEFDLQSTPAGVALAEFIESGQDGEQILPTDNFRLAGQDDSSATFVAPLPGDPPYADAQLKNDGSGWRVSGWGQCRPRIALRGAGAAGWLLPEDEVVNRTTTTFTALVTERSCTGGSSSEGRVREPLVIYEPDRVVVIFTVDPLPSGAYNCQGNPSTRVRVDLSEPLRDRRLLDGGRFPFGDPTLSPWER